MSNFRAWIDQLDIDTCSEMAYLGVVEGFHSVGSSHFE
jgi:hypothetical protein